VSDPAQGLARLLAAGAAQQRRQDRQPYATRMLTGTVVSWSSGPGYVVNVAGAHLSGLLVLGGASFSPGDAVVCLQYKSSILVLGKAAVAGT
jgi:hypothetical protein